MNNQTRTSYRPAKTQSARAMNLILALLILASTSLSGLWESQPLYAQATIQTTKASTPSRVAVVGSTPALLVAAPDGDILQTLAPGDPLTANGRTADSQWVAVTTRSGVSGWVGAQQLILFGLAELPTVTAAVAEPTTLITQTVTQSTATAPLATTVSSSPVLTATPTVQLLATVTVTDGRLNVRSGPATTYPVISKVTSGQTYIAQARTADSNWIKVVLPVGELGWVARQYVALSDEPTELPLSAPVSPPPLPQAAPTTALAQPTTAVATTSTPSGLQGKLVISTDNGGLFYLYNLATGELRPLTSGQDPALSPDGTQVAFTRSGGENGLYLINSDGSGEQKIFGEQDQLRSPQWSPDGQWIVFSRSAGQWTCYDLGRECATREALLSQLPPTVAKDPAAVAQFLGQFDAVENPNWSIARVNTTGGDYRDIAALDTARTPDWSAGGIVYQSAAGIQKTDDSAAAENQVVVAGHNLQDPDWRPGPEGTPGRIVYQTKRGDHWEIFSVNPDGTDNVALTRPVTTLVDQLPSNVAPAWSPDGQHIVYLSNRGENHSAGAWRLWVMNADGSDQRLLPVALSINYGYGLEQMVTWGQ